MQISVLKQIDKSGNEISPISASYAGYTAVKIKGNNFNVRKILKYINNYLIAY